MHWGIMLTPLVEGLRTRVGYITPNEIWGIVQMSQKLIIKSGVYICGKHEIFFGLLNFPLGLKCTLNHFRVQGGVN